MFADNVTVKILLIFKTLRRAGFLLNRVVVSLWKLTRQRVALRRISDTVFIYIIISVDDGELTSAVSERRASC